MKTLLTTAGALACTCALPAFASTYVVDAAAGPGTDFTSIVSAISAAVDGDVLIVRAGAYEPIHLDEALTLLCDANASSPVLDIHGLTSGEVAVVSGLTTFDINLTNCAGAVILDQVSADNSPAFVTTPARPSLDIGSCADVRLYRSTFVADNYTYGSFLRPGDDAVTIYASRVELVRCTVRGGSRGYAFASCHPGKYSSGGTGILIGGSSNVHVALSSVWGGRGSGLGLGCMSESGDGGPAIWLRSGSSLIVAGVPGDIIKGGRPGALTFSAGGTNGVHGAPLRVDSGCTARYSGCTFGPAANAGAGTFEQPSPPDPTLERLGDGLAGSNVTLLVHGATGWLAELERGRQPIIAPGAGPVPTLVQALALFQLGLIPSSGEIDKVAAISASDPAGTLYVWQGITSSPALEERRTNSVPVIVR